MQVIAKRRISLLWVLVLSLVLATVVALPSQAAPPGEDGPIVYTTESELRAVNPDGSGDRLVAAGTFAEPDVSPDGRSVLVVEMTGITFVGPLVSIDLATGDKTTVVATDTKGGYWSGDGDRIAYADDDGVWVKEGNAAATLVSAAHNDLYDWSPVDDRLIVVRIVTPQNSNPEIYLETLDIDTKQTVGIADNGPGLFTWYPVDADFSPDGEDVVYGTGDLGGIEVKIWGDEQNPLDTRAAWGEPNGYVAWSPDGEYIAYPTYVLNQQQSEGIPVMAIHTAGTDSRTTFGSEASQIDWAPATNGSSDGFTDVPSDSTFYDDVHWLANEGITKGCNPPTNDQFCPDDYVTRGQMAAFLHRGLNDVLTPTQMVEFVDDDGHTFEADIEWLGGTGVTKGCNPPTNDRYCPDDYVTRGQMAAFLVRALGYTDDGGGDLFNDDDGNTFESDIDKLGTAGVTKGCNPPTNDQFCPDDYVTRGQMAAFLHRALGD